MSSKVPITIKLFALAYNNFFAHTPLAQNQHFRRKNFINAKRKHFEFIRPIKNYASFHRHTSLVLLARSIDFLPLKKDCVNFIHKFVHFSGFVKGAQA